MQSRLLPYLAFAAIVIGFGNFFLFWVETFPMGLIPSDAYVSGGHHFVWSKNEGGYIELSQPYWAWIRLQGMSIFVTHPLAIASMAYLAFKFELPSMLAGRDRTAATNRERSVRAEGTPVASDRLGARIGQLFLSSPLVRVEVFPTGIVLKPVFMAPRVILAAEIERVRYVKGWWTGRGLEIVHAGTDWQSPVFLFVSEQDPVAQAISAVAGQAVATSSSNLPHPTPPEASWSSGMPAGIALGMQVLGLAVSALLVVIGVVWLIPQLGVFGWIWTGTILFIGAVNARRFLRG